jgi:hypothetical protein
MTNDSDVIELNGGESIQGSYDECDGEPAFVIADTTRDDTWLSITEGEEVTVRERR